MAAGWKDRFSLARNALGSRLSTPTLGVYKPRLCGYSGAYASGRLCTFSNIRQDIMDKLFRSSTLRLAGAADSPSDSREGLPLYLSPVKAGFPSPADDFIERKLDLHEHLVRNQAATFSCARRAIPCLARASMTETCSSLTAP